MEMYTEREGEEDYEDVFGDPGGVGSVGGRRTRETGGVDENRESLASRVGGGR